MMNITINIQAPQLAHAIETLAIAIGCTVDKIGVGEAVKEAVDQGSTKETKEGKKVTETTEKVTQKPEKVAKEPEQTPDQEMVENDDPPITIEEVREAFMAKNSKANTAKLKAILKKHNVVKVTDLPENTFAEVIKELEAI